MSIFDTRNWNELLKGHRSFFAQQERRNLESYVQQKRGIIANIEHLTDSELRAIAFPQGTGTDMSEVDSGAIRAILDRTVARTAGIRKAGPANMDRATLVISALLDGIIEIGVLVERAERAPSTPDTLGENP